MMLSQVVPNIPVRLGRKRLTFDEVVENRRVALFHEFGDSLLYIDGEVFVLQGADLFGHPDATLLVLDARSVVSAVGFETGWHHARDCDCRACSAKVLAA